MRLLPAAHYLLPTRKGQAVLSLVFLVGGVLTVVSVTLAFIVLTFINSSSGFEKSNRAIAVASAGVSDALLQLARDKDFPSVSPYTVSVGTLTASVTVNKNSPVTGQVTIISAATVNFYQRRIQAIVSVTSSTGEVQVLSWGETTL